MTARGPEQKWPLAFRVVDEGRVNGRVAECVELARQGLVGREIGDQLGIATTTALQYLGDPLGEKVAARKARYRVPCSECGTPINPGGTRKGSTGLCLACRQNRNEERNDLLREMWEANEPVFHIAEKLGMSEAAVRTWVSMRRRRGEDLSLRRLGGDKAERDGRRRAIIAWRREGLHDAEIAERLGTTAESVRQMFRTARALGFEVPPGNGPSRGPAAGLIPVEEFIGLVEEGLTDRHLADHIGLSSPRVAYERRRRLESKGLIGEVEA